MEIDDSLTRASGPSDAESWQNQDIIACIPKTTLLPGYGELKPSCLSKNVLTMPKSFKTYATVLRHHMHQARDRSEHEHS